MRRYGITLPLDGVPLEGQRAWVEALTRLGYTDFWTGDANFGAFTLLAQVALWAPGARLGTVTLPRYTAETLALVAASLAAAAPGRFVLGLGSNPILEPSSDLHADVVDRHMRDRVRFLRRALRGERVDEAFETFSLSEFRLSKVPRIPPKLMIAAVGPEALRLAAREADGAILSWISADDVKRVEPLFRERREDRELLARIFVCPIGDAAVARRVARRLMAPYLVAPICAEFQRWLGRGAALAEMWERWERGDRSAASDAIPDSVVDDLIVHGSTEECRAHVLRYVASGIDTPVVQLVAAGCDLATALRGIAPIPDGF